MTNTNPGSGKPPPTVSINDNLPNSNPPLKVVLSVLGVLAVVAVFLIFHKSLGL